jgi:hypothetical protein
MSDNKTAPATSSKASILLPCLSLALTVAAFGLGAPARLARLNLHQSALELDTTIHYEPALSSARADVKAFDARRVLDELLSRPLVALK